ncbi:MAG: cytochrome c3 family protein [Deltaproteobacteria bacterium]|nr:cytochrome c3 family protein [Deltaproteobacteria bacterium]
MPGLILPAALLIVSWGAQASGAGKGTAPKQLENAQAGDCAACHGPALVLPKGHAATKDQDLGQCRECHNGKKAPHLRGNLPLSHLHALEGVSCADCHGGGDRYAVESGKCLECHESGEAVAKLTVPKDKVHNNPHESPHYGTDLDCEMCHHAHAKSENYCSQCHDETRVVP